MYTTHGASKTEICSRERRFNTFQRNMIHFLLQKIKIFSTKCKKTQQKTQNTPRKNTTKNSEHTKKYNQTKEIFSFFLFSF